MKIKLAFAILLLILTIGFVSASENITDTISTDIAQEPVGDEKTSLDEDVDVSVDVELKDTYYKNEKVKFFVTVKNMKGTAKDVKVLIEMSHDLKYKSSHADIGNYNPETNIWTIGDLPAKKSYKLTIITEKESLGGFLDAFAGTSSKDVDLSNNHAKGEIPVLVSAVAEDNNHKKYHSTSLYQKSAYSDYRILIKSTNKTVNANLEKEKTSNPIGLLFASLFSLICVRRYAK